MCSKQTFIKDNYHTLKEVLAEAYKRAAEGKGKERHANDEPFENQLIFIIEKLGVGFQLGQAIKKIVESKRLPKDQAINELYDAINYIAAHIIKLKTYETR